jgi:hypothetical protein
LYFEYSLARLLPADIPQGPRQKTASPIGDGMSVSEAAAAIIEATVHDGSEERKRRR